MGAQDRRSGVEKDVFFCFNFRISADLIFLIPMVLWFFLGF